MIRCLILVVVAFVPVVLATNPAHYHIGAVLTSPTNVNHFLKVNNCVQLDIQGVNSKYFQTIDDVNFEGDVLPEGVTLHGHSMLKQADAIEDTRVFCHQLMSNEVRTTTTTTNGIVCDTNCFPVVGSDHR